MQTVESVVEDLLINNPTLRDNDNMLIARVIKQLYGLTNTYDIALNVKGNVYETIRRSRAKIQERNPALKASDYVQSMRKNKEHQIRDQMRGL